MEDQHIIEDPVTILKDIFPGTSLQIINDVIHLVNEGNPHDTFYGRLENMINLLSGDGAWGGPMPEVIVNNVPSVNDALLTQHFDNLKIIFPDANPDYLWQFCKDRKATFNFEDALEELSREGYNKIEIDPLTIWEELKEALPEADPSYLRSQAEMLAPLPPQEIDNFLQNAIEKGYPSLKDYLTRKNEQDELALYKDQFTVERYLEVVPNPVDRYTSPQRQKALDGNADENDKQYALIFLYNNYGFIRKKYIDQLWRWKKMDLVEVCDRLDRMHKCMRRPRLPEYGVDTKNIALLQEIAYLQNKKLIKRYLKLKDDQYRFAKEEARKYNLFEECQCCFDEELIPEECYFCMKGCVFCKDCVKTGVENIIGRAEYRFPCFATCDSEFSIQTLQMVLPRKMFDRVVQKIASEEIKRANMEGLATCPFCDFAMILPQNERIFKCINQDCLVESCRECRHKSHVPLRCDEVEYDEDIRKRTYIENQMTEALTRTCYNCHKKFIKSSGCNKMACNCGAKMCYLCGAAINDYSHFGNNRCPLFSNDAEVDLRRVVEGGQKAKKEVGDVKVKFDPTNNIEKFFNV
ncbi:hypothetical protein NQ318_012157 [Aromia moschata]|uniref:RING-type domain-containing protein n=1 Tax=Aromia moschata TaxID=1265417 RepID=A0AAV8YZJ0_9CUCU|nr:hypothetical protein NQ318_012157 [Aromia moschata]